MSCQEQILSQTEAFVKEQLCGAESGHDWWHIYRVRNTALSIAKAENADVFIVELSALLHDISDAKFNGGDEDAGGKMASDFLASIGASDEVCKQVADIVDSVSFKGGFNIDKNDSIELYSVQDADRLDAIGAIGIARCFSYGGHKGREMYNPDVSPMEQMSLEQYRSNAGHSINHFYEKLLKLKDLMKTETGKILAEQRHKFMLQYLDQFFSEWS